MSDATSDMLLDSLKRLLASKLPVGDATKAPAEGWHKDVWREMDALGMTAITSSAYDDGLAMSAGVLTEIGRTASVVPYLEHDFVAGWILQAANVERPSGVVDTVAVVQPSGACAVRRRSNVWYVNGVIPRVPFASHAHAVVVVFGLDQRHWAARIPTASMRIILGKNLADEPRDDLHFDHLSVEGDQVFLLPGEFTLESVKARAALGRSCQMVGAMERAFALTHEYARNRVQFGRSLSQFQVIQSYLAEVVGEVCASRIMCDAAVQAGGIEEIAAAKIRVGQAARVVAERCHQIHGAIGFTREYALNLWTRRLWSWREEFGGEPIWADRLARSIAEIGADDMWARLAR